MRAWIFVLAVLATFQAIVQVASTDSSSTAAAAASATMLAQSQQQQQQRSTKSQQSRHRTSSASWSSPTLSFAAIVAAPISTSSSSSSSGRSANGELELDLTNLNNIVLNSDNVHHPSSVAHNKKHPDSAHLLLQQLLVPTNSSGEDVGEEEEVSAENENSVSNPSANSVVNNNKRRRNSSSSSSRRNSDRNNNNNNSNNISNSINPNQIEVNDLVWSSLSSDRDEISSSSSSQRKHRTRLAAGKGHRRRRRKQRVVKKELKSSQNDTSSSSSWENSMHLVEKKKKKEQQQVQIISNELKVEEDVSKTKEETREDVVTTEQDDDEDEEEQQLPQTKPDPETLVTIEKNLLSLFGFTKRPRIDRSKVVIPEAMRRMYEETTGMPLDLPDANEPKPANHRAHYTANTVRSFTHEESKIDHRFVHHHRFRLHFNTSNIPKDEILKAAELVLSRDAVPDADRIRHRVQVYDIIRPGVKGKREPVFLLIDTKVVKVNTTENLILDVSPALERWQREPKHNHGILVHVSTVGRRGPKRVARETSEQQQNSTTDSVQLDGPIHHHVRLRRSLRDTEEGWAKKQPLLFAYTDDKRHRSSRAAKDGHHGNGNGGGGGRARNRTKKKPRGICQRHALWVDFEDVGWNDWIVAPRGYDAFYCKGECRIPMADHLNATNHAVVQTLVNSINGQLAPRACCVPTQLTTISLLYLDDQNKLVLKKYQDMAVVGCGCR